MTSAQMAIGIVPAFVLSMVYATVQVGICEYRGKPCASEWGFVSFLLGAGSAGGAGFAAGHERGFNTLNPALKRPEEEPTRRVPPPRKNA